MEPQRLRKYNERGCVPFEPQGAFGATLDAVMTRYNTTAYELSKRIWGTERMQGSISRWRAGSRHPRRTNINKIATALKLSRQEAADLFRAAGYVPPWEIKMQV